MSLPQPAAPISSPVRRPPCSFRAPGGVLVVSLLYLVLALAALYFTPQCVFPVRRAAEALEFPYQLDAEEGFLLGQALRIVSGQGLYLPITSPPYVVDNYPPVYPALWSIAARWAGPSLAPGRWIVLAGVVGAALGIAAIVFCVGRSFVLAWLSALFFVTSGDLLRWMAYARVDLLAIGFTILGLAAMAAAGRRSRAARLAAVALFALALLTKQTVVAAPAACLIWLALADRRVALRFALGLLLAVGIPTAILCVWTRGQYWLHTVTYNRNVMRWHELAGWARHLWRLYPAALAAVLVLFAWSVCYLLRRGKPTAIAHKPTMPSEAFSLCLIYFLLNTLSLLSLAKAGAAENYLLEPTCAATIFLGVSLGAVFGQLLGENRRWSLDLALVAAAVRPTARGQDKIPRLNAFIAIVTVGLIAAHVACFGMRRIERYLFLGAPRPTVAALVEGDRVVREIRARPGQVLCEDPIYTLKAGRAILFQHFIMTQLAAEGRWDPAPVAAMAARGEFRLIAAHQNLFDESQFFDRYPPSFREAVRRRYVLLDRLTRGNLQTIFLYVPRHEAAK